MAELANPSTTPPSGTGDRRQVSVLFTDMVGYTAIVEGLGEEKALAFTQMIYEMLSTAVIEHGGTVRSFAGDSIMAVFGIPEALEDAALRACRAAISVHTAFVRASDAINKKFSVRPQMRVGICSGSAVMASIGDQGAELTVVGNTVNLASRVQALAPSGGTLICDDTRSLVEWLVNLSFDGEHEVKGISKVQKLWNLASIREAATRFDASLAQGLSDYVGRQDELAQMGQAFADAKDAVRVVDLVAEPGLGKTRLVFEFLERAKTDGVAVMTGQCSTDGQQVPFFPFLEILRGSFRISDDNDDTEVARKLKKGLAAAKLDTDQNLGLMLNVLGRKVPPGALDGLDGVLIGLRTRDLMPALLSAQTKATMVVLRLEDVHWIDNASEQLLHTLIKSDVLSNLLIIQTRRPEYQPEWQDTPCVTTLELAPLAATDIRDLAQRRLGVDTLPEALIEQITERAGGNPLFGEEILSFLVQQGALRVVDGVVEFDAALGASGLPASMQGLLTARMDRLQPEDRAVLQAAAAIGRRFSPALLASVDDGQDTQAALDRLQGQDIIMYEQNSTDMMFKHVLLRDSVYQGLLSTRRNDLHLAIGQAIEKRSQDRRSEAGTLAYHFGLTDRTDLAFRYAAFAGTSSLGIFSLDEANRYFGSALALYDHDPDCVAGDDFAAFLANYALCSSLSLRVRTMTELAIKVRPILDQLGDSRDHVHFLHHNVACLVWNGRYLDALRVQEGLTAMAERLGDNNSRAYALISELSVSCYCGQLTNDEFEAKKYEAEALMEGVDDAYLQNFFMANVGWNEVGRGRVLGAQEAADRLIEAGVDKNDPRALGYGTAMKALIAMVSNDYDKALEMSEQALEVSRAEFESAIANAAKHAALVPLAKPGAVEEVEAYVASCTARGLTLFLSGPDTMLGVARVMNGQIGEGLKHIELAIIRREKEGYDIAANWYRLFLCEIYIEILSGNGDASPSVLLRNIRPLAGIILFGGKRIVSLIDHVRANSDYDPNGHYIARMEMILGLLSKIKKKKEPAIAHLINAQRIVAPTGPSPMLDRIEAALSELQAG